MSKFLNTSLKSPPITNPIIIPICIKGVAMSIPYEMIPMEIPIMISIDSIKNHQKLILYIFSIILFNEAQRLGYG